MYIVPHKIPAPSAAHTPRIGCSDGPCVDDAIASSAPPAHSTNPPPKTPAHRRQPACRNSLKKINPHKIPSSCNFRAREVFPVAAPIELVTVDSKAPRNQRNECKSNKPPSKTITGTQNCTSVSTLRMRPLEFPPPLPCRTLKPSFSLP